MKKLELFIITSLLLSITLTSCSQKEAEEESRLSLIQTTNPSPVQLTNDNKGNVAESIKKDVMKYKEIYDVAVIRGRKDTVVVYKVKHMDRFSMKKIEKKIKKLLEDKYPDENFTVSSDYKIFMEALELKEEVENQKVSKEKAEKQLQKIIKMKDQQT